APQARFINCLPDTDHLRPVPFSQFCSLPDVILARPEILGKSLVDDCGFTSNCAVCGCEFAAARQRESDRLKVSRPNNGCCSNGKIAVLTGNIATGHFQPAFPCAACRNV